MGTMGSMGLWASAHCHQAERSKPLMPTGFTDECVEMCRNGYCLRLQTLDGTAQQSQYRSDV